MKRVFRNVFTVAFLLLILIGCSTTKRIADDEVLYTGVKKMEIIPDSGVKIADAAASDDLLFPSHPTILCSLLISARRFP